MTRIPLLALAGAAAALAVAPSRAACPLAPPADCVYVDDTSPNDPGTGTQPDPFRRIQDAYDSVITTTTPTDPATILVLAGTYNECVNASSTFDPEHLFNDDRPARFVADEWLKAGSPDPSHADTAPFEQVASMTTISGVGVCDVNQLEPLPTISVAGTGASVQGFRITGGGLAGIEARGPVDLSNNFVVNNDGRLGGGINYVTATCAFGEVTATIRHNVLLQNMADDLGELGLGGSGGGIFVFAEGVNVDSATCDFPATPGFFGRSSVTVADNYLADNEARNIDTVANDDFASGGGMALETQAEQSLSSVPAEFPSATIVASGNTVRDCTVRTNAPIDADDLPFSVGGGIAAATLGFGVEIVEITGNSVGPGNLATGGFSFGGGISISPDILNNGIQRVTVHDNSVFENRATVGAGIDVFAIAENLNPGQRQVVEVTNNRISNNLSVQAAGGLNIDYSAVRALDVADQPLFPGAANPANEMTVRVRGNVITDNTAGTAGGGAVLRADASGDNFFPTLPPASQCQPGGFEPAVAILDFEQNYLENNLAQQVVQIGTPGCSDATCEGTICGPPGDPFCCDVFWDQICADAAFDSCVDVCGTSDCCEKHTGLVVGAGILALPRATGQAHAAIHIETTTVVGNQVSDGFVGGLETMGITLPNCNDSSTGEVALSVRRSIIGDNDQAGFGGPGFARVFPDFTFDVSQTSVFGNAGQQYEDSIFPDGPPPGNILADPLLDPTSFAPDLCSPVFDVGSCSGDPTIDCSADLDCGADGPCVAAGAGYLATPDVNGDDAVDGVDLVQFSLSFGADDEHTRYVPTADLDRNGMIEGTDLPFIAPLFGRECTP